MRDEIPSRGESKIWERKNRAGQFLKCECGRRTGMRPRQGHRAKEVNEPTHRLLELVDSRDAEYRSELDVNQIGKDLQRENHRTLSEEVITTPTRRSW